MKNITLHIKKGIILFLAYGAFLLPGSGQIVTTAKIQADSVLIGDPVKVDITVTVPDNIDLEGLDFSIYKKIENQWYFNDTILLDKYADISILDFGHWKHQDESLPVPGSSLQLDRTKNGQLVIRNTITIAVYNAGSFSIPGPDVISKDQMASLPGQSASLKVYLPRNLMQQDTVVFHPIKDIMAEKADLSDYLLYVYMALGLLLLGVTGYYFYRQKKHTPLPPDVEIAPVIPAHQKALEALQLLDRQALWQQGFIKEYQTALTHIIRTYIEDRYDVRAIEMTSDEIISTLSGMDFNHDYATDLREILQIADLVKFAKAIPENDVHARFLHKAVHFVENTKDVS